MVAFLRLSDRAAFPGTHDSQRAKLCATEPARLSRSSARVRTFDAANYAYIKDITAEVTGGEAPAVIATQLRAEGVDIGIISRQLGHASINTTARYLDHLAPRAVIEAMRGRSWTGA